MLELGWVGLRNTALKDATSIKNVSKHMMRHYLRETEVRVLKWEFLVLIYSVNCTKYFSAYFISIEQFYEGRSSAQLIKS